MIDIKDSLWVPRLVIGQGIDNVKKFIKGKEASEEDKRIHHLKMDNVKEEHGYPRPQMVRDSFLSLNGTWEIEPCMAEQELQPEEYHHTIRVPYPVEAELSGYHGPEAEKFWYHKSFVVPTEFVKERVILHFGAVDQIAEVYLNGQCLGRHEGGYLPFSFDVTEQLIAGGNDLVVYAEDTLDPVYPYGKQTKTPGGMWYTPVTGIWQSVWLESVPEQYIESVTCNYREPYVEVEINGTADSYTMHLGEKIIALKNGMNKLYLKNPHFWSPADPYLYRFELSTEEDTVQSYFAVRTVGLETVNGRKTMCLNHKPYFFHGVLDQGYFPDGLFTPAADSCYEQDIILMKELGFNTLRKHIKIEPSVFYEACDRLGMIVFQDMVNNGEYDYFRDTLMPTIGSKKKDDTTKDPTPAQKFFYQHAKDTVRYLKGFPSIVLYTVFNEGWGQFCSEYVTKKLKQIDDTRVYDSTSGWFWQGTEEIHSDHVYFHKVWPMEKGDLRPRIISECGGYSLLVKDHTYCPAKSYGYGAKHTVQELTQEIVRFYTEEILPEIEEGCCGVIYTQLSDVEEEINGLYTYDRAICKVDKQSLLDVGTVLLAQRASLWHEDCPLS